MTSDVIEAAYNSVWLWAQSRLRGRDRQIVADVIRAMRRQSLNAPEGIVTVDEETQHTWRPVYVGRIRADGQFDLVWSSEKPIRPIPYPRSRSQCGVGLVSRESLPNLGRVGKSRYRDGPRREVAATIPRPRSRNAEMRSSTASDRHRDGPMKAMQSILTSFRCNQP